MPLLAPLGLGPLEIGLILVIIVIVFGVGRLPEVGGAIGKSIREFRKSSHEDDDAPPSAAATTDTPSQPTEASPDTVFCGECGTRNPRANKFCSQCGHTIGAAVS